MNSNKKSITDYDLSNKRIIIRCDLNVPFLNGEISDDNRIKASLQTINYALENNAKVIVMSHLGKVKKEEDKKNNSLEKIATYLSKLISNKVYFCNETRGIKLEKMVKDLNNKEVLVIENTRFEDVIDKKESSNNSELARYWASLGDIFINDAYGSCHRTHASVVGIAQYLPSGLGFLPLKEIKALDLVLENPKRPYIVIMGGAKVKDKIKLIENLITKADKILIGGGMCYTFLKAQGKEIGTSLLDEESLKFCANILNKYGKKIILPIDVKVTSKFEDTSNYETVSTSKIPNYKMGLDIGSKTEKLFNEELKGAKSIILNGPVGVFEFENFSNGTKTLLESLSKLDGKVIISGGDSAAAAIKFGYKNSFYHISTGGGATLEYIQGDDLPGISIIGVKCEKF
ncbi:MAG: phosphoglycerate kinase [Bacilli bacterium]